MSEDLQRLHEWVDCVNSYKEGLQLIVKSVDRTLDQCRAITDEDAASAAGVEMLFLRNRIESMIKVWLGDGSDADE